MTEPNYDIFFRGETLDNFDLNDVKHAMAQLFKASPEKIEQLFSGKVVSLKKDLDKATTLKFKQALEKAGAKIYIKAAATNTTPTAPNSPDIPKPNTITTETATPIKTTEPKSPALADLVILPPGSDVLTAAEKTVVIPVNVDISGIKMASVFDQVAEQVKPTPKAPDVSHITAAPAGADILGGVKKTPPPPAPNVDHISISAVGADLTEGIIKTAIPPAPDVSHLSTAAVGADILEGIDKKSTPPAPDISHISLAT